MQLRTNRSPAAVSAALDEALAHRRWPGVNGEGEFRLQDPTGRRTQLEMLKFVGSIRLPAGEESGTLLDIAWRPALASYSVVPVWIRSVVWILDSAMRDVGIGLAAVATGATLVGAWLELLALPSWLIKLLSAH